MATGMGEGVALMVGAGVGLGGGSPPPSPSPPPPFGGRPGVTSATHFSSTTTFSGGQGEPEGLVAPSRQNRLAPGTQGPLQLLFMSLEVLPYRPAGHGVQLAAFASLNLPGGHGFRRSPGAQYVPFRQAIEHLVEPGLLDLPPGHREQVVALGSLKYPSSHIVTGPRGPWGHWYPPWHTHHLPMPPRLVVLAGHATPVGVVDPGGHQKPGATSHASEQPALCCPSLSPKTPAGQSSHFVPLEAYWPARHSVPLGDVDPGPHTVPLAGTQTPEQASLVRPLAFPKVPEGHGEHAVALGRLKYPWAHCTARVPPLPLHANPAMHTQVALPSGRAMPGAHGDPVMFTAPVRHSAPVPGTQSPLHSGVDAPRVSLYFPAGQGVHPTAASRLYVPRGQGVTSEPPRQ